MWRARVTLSFGLSFGLTIGGLSQAVAQETQPSVIATFTLDASTDHGPVPIVYVRGEIAGIVPGSIVVPLRDEGVAIEIGLPQIGRIPLYSFVLGRAEIER
jgi:hypothetical protein